MLYSTSDHISQSLLLRVVSLAQIHEKNILRPNLGLSFLKNKIQY